MQLIKKEGLAEKQRSSALKRHAMLTRLKCLLLRIKTFYLSILLHYERFKHNKDAYLCPANSDAVYQDKLQIQICKKNEKTNGCRYEIGTQPTKEHPYHLCSFY